MILSVLIPSIPSRFDRLKTLYMNLYNQSKGLEVEILVLIDNKKRSIGTKRNDLVQLAQGKYLAFVDDDDKASSNYIEEMLKGCEANKDLICFRQLAKVNDTWSYVDFSMNNTNEEYQISSITRRKPFHVCGIRSSIAKQFKFPDVGYGEDWHWMEQVLSIAKTEYKTDKVLHFYEYRRDVSEAPIETNEIWKNLDLDYKKNEESSN